MLQVRGLDPDPIYESSVCRTEVTEESLRRSDLENAVMARKESVLRQAELRVVTSPDHESVVLVESEVAAGLWAGYYM